jgi:hypothetical protein
VVAVRLAPDARTLSAAAARAAVDADGQFARRPPLRPHDRAAAARREETGRTRIASRGPSRADRLPGPRPRTAPLRPVRTGRAGAWSLDRTGDRDRPGPSGPRPMRRRDGPRATPTGRPPAAPEPTANSGSPSAAPVGQRARLPGAPDTTPGMNEARHGAARLTPPGSAGVGVPRQSGWLCPVPWPAEVGSPDALAPRHPMVDDGTGTLSAFSR